MKTIIVDTLGNDRGSEVIISAIKDFKMENPNINIIAVGDKKTNDALKNICEVVYAPDVISMEAGPIETMRMTNSSLYAAVDLLSKHRGDALVSCGSNGGLVTISMSLLGLVEGIIKPAFVVQLPSIVKKKRTLLLDIGANNQNSPEELAQFAYMGEVYSKCVLGNQNPRIYLLSDGREEGKGSPVNKHAYILLKNNPHFCGNIEAKEVLNGEADVVVCDGFSGNILLKSIEGTTKLFRTLIAEAFNKNEKTRAAYGQMREEIESINALMDYKTAGGAMLLGVNGIAVMAHGNASSFTFKNAIYLALNLVNDEIDKKILGGLKNE